MGSNKKCSMCTSENWWQSVFGQCICRVCHPPANPDLEMTSTETNAIPSETAPPAAAPESEAA